MLGTLLMGVVIVLLLYLLVSERANTHKLEHDIVDLRAALKIQINRQLNIED